jgi:peptide-methionine (R)-S-oxide reductase
MTQTSDRRTFLTTSALALAGAAMASAALPAFAAAPRPLRLSDAEWRRRLSPPAYAVLRQRISAARRLSELFLKPASQNRLPATGLENPLAGSVSTTPRLQAAPDDGEHIGR